MLADRCPGRARRRGRTTRDQARLSLLPRAHAAAADRYRTRRHLRRLSTHKRMIRAGTPARLTRLPTAPSRRSVWRRCCRLVAWREGRVPGTRAEPVGRHGYRAAGDPRGRGWDDDGVRVLVPLPDRDFDVTEVAVPWKLLRRGRARGGLRHRAWVPRACGGPSAAHRGHLRQARR